MCVCDLEKGPPAKKKRGGAGGYRFVRTEIEGVPGGRRQDHEDGQGPFDEVGAQWGLEWAGRCPEAREGQDALSAEQRLLG